MNSEEREAYLNRGFSEAQTDEISLGMDSGVDVSIFAKAELNAACMYQLRLGLAEGLNMAPYAKADYDWFQMEEIRRGLSLGLDVSLFDTPDIGADRMHELRLALENGSNIAEYKDYSASILREIRKSLADGVDISIYVPAGYDAYQLAEIRHALAEKLDIHGFLDVDFSAAAISEIAKGLREGLNVELYAKKQYTWLQMRELRRGLSRQLDISYYASPLYDRFQMEQIRLGLEEGIDVSEFSSLVYPASYMAKLRSEALVHGNTEDGDREDAEESRDGILVTIARDDMTAFIRVAKDRFGSYTRKDLLRSLRRKGITQNIDARMMDDLLSGKNLDEDVIIATGKNPIDGEDGHFEFFFNVDKDKTPTILPDGSVDFQNIDWFEHVKRGQKLAYYHSPGSGEAGHTVTGRRLVPKRGKELPILKGSGFYIETDRKTYISEYDGRVEYLPGNLSVSKNLTISGVNQASGNVRFEGNIMIAGNVSDGVLIESGGDVIVEGFVENATIKAAGDIILKKGVNGNGAGKLIAGGRVEGKFLENVDVVANGEIDINYCLNCNISTEDKLLVHGNKGMILGGNIFAAKDIKAVNVGNEAGVRTNIRMGISDKMLKSQREIEEHLAELEGKLNVLYKGQASLSQKYSEEERSEVELYGKIENAIYTLRLEKDEYSIKREMIIKHISATADAMLTVSGNLYDNVYIDLDGRKLMSSRAKNVTVKKVESRVGIFQNIN